MLGILLFILLYICVVFEGIIDIPNPPLFIPGGLPKRPDESSSSSSSPKLLKILERLNFPPIAVFLKLFVAILLFITLTFAILLLLIIIGFGCTVVFLSKPPSPSPILTFSSTCIDAIVGFINSFSPSFFSFSSPNIF